MISDRKAEDVPTILVVEDEPVTSHDLREALEANGYNVVGICTNMEDAIVAIRSNPPDMVLMDIRLKGDGDGIDVASQIEEDLGVAIVFLTAFADKATFDRAKMTRPYGYVIKPFKEESLLREVGMALDNQKRLNMVIGRERMVFSSLQSMEESMIAIDVDERVNFLNPCAERMLSQSNSSTIGKPIWDVVRLVHSETRRKVRPAVVKKILNEEELKFDFPLSLLIAGKGDIPVDVQFSDWKNDKGELIGAIIVIEDQTLKKENQGVLMQNLESAINALHSEGGEQSTGREAGKPGSALVRIASMLDRILYIQADSPYSIVVLDAREEETIKFRIAFARLEACFSEDSLLRVHRSYLVNPNRVMEVTKKSERDHEVLLKDYRNETLRLPVGRGQIRQIRERYSDWFKLL